jgi:hypothetical protein
LPIGSLGKARSRACVANITVRNAVIRSSDNGVRIKTWQRGSGSVSGVSFESVRMDKVRNPIIIDQYYCLSHDCDNSTTAVLVSGVSYAGIRGTCAPCPSTSAAATPCPAPTSRSPTSSCCRRPGRRSRTPSAGTCTATPPRPPCRPWTASAKACPGMAPRTTPA